MVGCCLAQAGREWACGVLGSLLCLVLVPACMSGSGMGFETPTAEAACDGAELPFPGTCRQ